MTTSKAIVTTKNTAPRPHKKTIKITYYVLFLIMLSGLVYNIYLAQKISKTTTQEIQRLNTRIENLNQQQTQSTNETIQSLQQLKNVQQIFEDRQKQQNAKNTDWPLYRARYYLELAQIAMHWDYYSQIALTLLEQADILIMQMHDEKVLAIRQAIANEILLIKQNPAPDMVGILSQLDALQTTIQHLPQQYFITENKSQHNILHPNNSTYWQKSLQILQSLIIIKERNPTTEPIMTPTYAETLRRMLSLSLQEAQWAVLQHNDAIYQFTLQQTIKTLCQILDCHTDKAQKIIHQIHTLQKISLKQPETTPSQSLSLLNTWIREGIQ